MYLAGPLPLGPETAIRNLPLPNVALIDFVTSPPGFFVQSIDRLTGAAITGFGPSVTFLANGTTAYKFSGSGFTYALVGDTRILTGGVLTGIEVFLNGNSAMTLTGLSLSATSLQNAIDSDAAGTDNAAVENLFLPLGWAYTGKAGRDVLRASDLSSDGTPFDLAGRDTIATGDGNDDFFLGAGDDAGFGGRGGDRLEGGRGKDTLFGDAGNDTLLGGSSADTLYGGAGHDALDGGNEADRLTGGTGRDTMTGGAGRDTFVFALRDGADQISDFNPATDRIDLVAGVAHHFTAAGADTVLHYGNFGDQILLTGIDITEASTLTIL